MSSSIDGLEDPVFENKRFKPTKENNEPSPVPSFDHEIVPLDDSTLTNFNLAPEVHPLTDSTAIPVASMSPSYVENINLEGQKPIPGSEGKKKEGKPKPPRKQPARKFVNLLDLLRVGLIKPGKGVISSEYKTNVYHGDLFEDATIAYEEPLVEKRLFSSLSAFAIFCVRKTTPNRQACDGWTHVKYNDLLLSEIRDLYLKQFGPPLATTPEPKAKKPKKTPSEKKSSKVSKKAIVSSKKKKMAKNDDKMNPDTVAANILRNLDNNSLKVTTATPSRKSDPAAESAADKNNTTGSMNNNLGGTNTMKDATSVGTDGTRGTAALLPRNSCLPNKNDVEVALVKVYDIFCKCNIYGIRCDGFSFNVVYLQSCQCPFPYCHARYFKQTEIVECGVGFLSPLILEQKFALVRDFDSYLKKNEMFDKIKGKVNKFQQDLDAIDDVITGGTPFCQLIPKVLPNINEDDSTDLDKGVAESPSINLINNSTSADDLANSESDKKNSVDASQIDQTITSSSSLSSSSSSSSSSKRSSSKSSQSLSALTDNKPTDTITASATILTEKSEESCLTSQDLLSSSSSSTKKALTSIAPASTSNSTSSSSSPSSKPVERDLKSMVRILADLQNKFRAEQRTIFVNRSLQMTIQEKEIELKNELEKIKKTIELLNSDKLQFVKTYESSVSESQNNLIQLANYETLMEQFSTILSGEILSLTDDRKSLYTSADLILVFNAMVHQKNRTLPSLPPLHYFPGFEK